MSRPHTVGGQGMAGLSERQKLGQTEMHIPGYTGFVPKFKYLYGSTYGDGTRRLITSALPPKKREINIIQRTTKGQQTRSMTLPIPGFTNEKPNDDFHVPGYTGFLAGGNQVYGKTYGSASRFALGNLSPPKLRESREALRGATDTSHLKTPLALENNPDRPPHPPKFRPSSVYHDPNRDWKKCTYIEYDLKNSMNRTSIVLGDRAHWGPENYTSTLSENFVEHPQVTWPNEPIASLKNWPGPPPRYLPG